MKHHKTNFKDLNHFKLVNFKDKNTFCRSTFDLRTLFLGCSVKKQFLFYNSKVLKFRINIESSIKYQIKYLKVRKSAFNYDLKTKMDEKLFSHLLWNQFLIHIGSYKLKLFLCLLNV